MAHNGCTPPAVSCAIWRRATQAGQDSSTHSWLAAALVFLLPGAAFSSSVKVRWGSSLARPTSPAVGELCLVTKGVHEQSKQNACDGQHANRHHSSR